MNFNEIAIRDALLLLFCSSYNVDKKAILRLCEHRRKKMTLSLFCHDKGNFLAYLIIEFKHQSLVSFGYFIDSIDCILLESILERELFSSNYPLLHT